MTRRGFLALPLAWPLAAQQAGGEGDAPVNIAPYYPTPMPVALRMLELGELKPSELHYDLGSGDGRLVILAARNFSARSVGFEIDPKLVISSRRQIERLKLGERASIEQRDLYQADFSQADLISVYLLPRALDLLRPLLEKQMKPGARVVSHDFAIPGWDADETLTLDDEPDIEGLLHTIYLYRR